mmetsp:Transcript_172/g.581  ORF Transcript_172/g.581 Transcript_172/m.581 type:complete len:661 (+) Transcript_172:658-2640(+)
MLLLLLLLLLLFPPPDPNAGAGLLLPNRALLVLLVPELLPNPKPPAAGLAPDEETPKGLELDAPPNGLELPEPPPEVFMPEDIAPKLLPEAPNWLEAAWFELAPKVFPEVVFEELPNEVLPVAAVPEPVGLGWLDAPKVNPEEPAPNPPPAVGVPLELDPNGPAVELLLALMLELDDAFGPAEKLKPWTPDGGLFPPKLLLLLLLVNGFGIGSTEPAPVVLVFFAPLVLELAEKLKPAPLGFFSPGPEEGEADAVELAPKVNPPGSGAAALSSPPAAGLVAVDAEKLNPPLWLLKGFSSLGGSVVVEGGASAAGFVVVEEKLNNPPPAAFSGAFSSAATSALGLLEPPNVKLWLGVFVSSSGDEEALVPKLEPNALGLAEVDTPPNNPLLLTLAPASALPALELENRLVESVFFSPELAPNVNGFEVELDDSVALLVAEAVSSSSAEAFCALLVEDSPNPMPWFCGLIVAVEPNENGAGALEFSVSLEGAGDWPNLNGAGVGAEPEEVLDGIPNENALGCSDASPSPDGFEPNENELLLLGLAVFAAALVKSGTTLLFELELEPNKLLVAGSSAFAASLLNSPSLLAGASFRGFSQETQIESEFLFLTQHSEHFHILLGSRNFSKSELSCSGRASLAGGSGVCFPALANEKDCSEAGAAD